MTQVNTCAEHHSFFLILQVSPFILRQIVNIYDCVVYLIGQKHLLNSDHLPRDNHVNKIVWKNNNTARARVAKEQEHITHDMICMHKCSISVYLCLSWTFHEVLQWDRYDNHLPWRQKPLAYVILSHCPAWHVERLGDTQAPCSRSSQVITGQFPAVVKPPKERQNNYLAILSQLSYWHNQDKVHRTRLVGWTLIFLSFHLLITPHVS